MQTLTQNALEFRHNDTEVIIYRNGQNVGRIAYSFEYMRWEYNAYGKPAKATGTLEHCKAVAESDLNPESNTATVSHIADDVKPAYVHRGTSWRVSGSGYEQHVTVQQHGCTYRVLVPSGFAQQLRVGSVVELQHDRLNGFYLRWPNRPVRRQLVAA